MVTSRVEFNWIFNHNTIHVPGNAMTVTIYFAKGPGPKQIQSITLRVETESYSDAVKQSIDFVQSIITTILITSVTVRRD